MDPNKILAIVVSSAIANEVWRAYEINHLYPEDFDLYFKHGGKYNNAMKVLKNEVGLSDIWDYHFNKKRREGISKFDSDVLDTFEEKRKEEYHVRREIDYLFNFKNFN